MNSIKYIVAIVAVLGLVFMTLTPSLPIDIVFFPYADKVYHVLGFAMLTLALTRILSIRKSVFVAILFALSTEYMQSFVPTRGVSGGDLLANLSGIIFIWIAFNATVIDKFKLTFSSK